MARPAEMTPLDSRGQRPKLLQDYPLLAAMNQAEMTGHRTSIGALLLRCCLIKLDGTRHVVSLMSVAGGWQSGGYPRQVLGHVGRVAMLIEDPTD